MAKIKSSFKDKIMFQKIESIRQKIDNNHSYINVLEEKYKEKNDKKLNDLKLKHNQYLLNLESKTLTKEKYLEIFSKKDMEQLGDWFYWKKRAIDQTLNRNLKKQPEQKDLYKQKQQEQLDNLNQAYEMKKAKVIEKFSIAAPTALEIKQNEKVFIEEKKRLDEEYKIYEETLKKRSS